MDPQPAHLSLHDDHSEAPQAPRMPFQLDLPSPRAGEVPPALSPLDAFAMRSRMLAKRFEDEAQKGRRISRLPPLTVQKEMGSRAEHFRSASGGSDGSGMGDLPEVQEETSPTARGGLMVSDSGPDRPLSQYPMLGNMARGVNDRLYETPFFDAQERQHEEQPDDYFAIGVPRSFSPVPVDPKLNVEAPSPMAPSLTNSVDSVQSSSNPRTFTTSSTRSQHSLRSERGLAPPRSPAHPKSPRSFQSIRSIRRDSGDEDGTSSLSGSRGLPLSRKFSGSSNMSPPPSPFSPYPPSHYRTPSLTSESSVGAAQHQQPSTVRVGHFSPSLSSGDRSRPSIDSRPSFETRLSEESPHRHPSAAGNGTLPSSSTRPLMQIPQDDAKTAFASADLGSSGQAEGAGGEHSSSHGSEPLPAPSYIYTKYSLPRGRSVELNSLGNRESWLQHQFTWEETKPPPEEPHNAQGSLKLRIGLAFEPPICKASPASPAGSERIPVARLSSRPRERDAISQSRSNWIDTRSAVEKPPSHRATPSTMTESTDKTIKAAPLHHRSRSAELTPEEHLEMGIQEHSAGQLNKSTYHLRLAAKAGLPTGMLLYALACRHGWGMRPSQEDGVMWLRKAIEGSGLDVFDVEETVSHASRSLKADPAEDALERKNRKAQFALAMYELGISYMNGWGCPKDKALAVRCYEVAGDWGDCDALAEAGFCYAQGVGCKKDARKAAAMYRKAAEGGMSMAGNSWIYKSKYMDEAPKTPEKKQQQQQQSDIMKSDEAKEKPTTRSRTRSIWGRRKDRPT